MITPVAYSIAEAATYTGLSRATLYRKIGSGELASRKIAGRRLVLKRDLDRFVGLEPEAAAND